MNQRVIYGDFINSAPGLIGRYDVVICDPPYSEHVHKNATSQSAGGGTRHRDLGFDHLSPVLRQAIATAIRHAQRWGLVYSDIEGLHEWIAACDNDHTQYIRTVPWVRWSMPQLSGDRPPQGFECLSLYHARTRKRWNGPGNLTHMSHTCLRGDGKHRAEKPLDQALDLVSWFTDEGETVLDPCAGSGTVGLACKLLKRGYIGFEIDAAWADKADKRIQDPVLGERDRDRLARWLDSQEVAKEDATRRKAITARQRAKNEVAKA